MLVINEEYNQQADAPTTTNNSLIDAANAGAVNFSRGISQVGASLAEDSLPLTSLLRQRRADEQQREVQEFMEASALGQDPWSLAGVGQALAFGAPEMGLTALSMGAGIPAVAVSRAGQTYQEQAPEDRSYATALPAGVISAGLERVGLGAAMRPATGAMGRIGTAVVAEGATEGLQSLTDQFATTGTVDPMQVGESALFGSMLGGGLKGVGELSPSKLKAVSLSKSETPTETTVPMRDSDGNTYHIESSLISALEDPSIEFALNKYADLGLVPTKSANERFDIKYTGNPLADIADTGAVSGTFSGEFFNARSIRKKVAELNKVSHEVGRDYRRITEQLNERVTDPTVSVEATRLRTKVRELREGYTDAALQPRDATVEQVARLKDLESELRALGIEAPELAQNFENLSAFSRMVDADVSGNLSSERGSYSVSDDLGGGLGGFLGGSLGSKVLPALGVYATGPWSELGGLSAVAIKGVSNKARANKLADAIRIKGLTQTFQDTLELSGISPQRQQELFSNPKVLSVLGGYGPVTEAETSTLEEEGVPAIVSDLIIVNRGMPY